MVVKHKAGRPSSYMPPEVRNPAALPALQASVYRPTVRDNSPGAASPRMNV